MNEFNEGEEEYPGDHIANVDQMQEDVIGVGAVARTYFYNLMAMGFTRREAFALTAQWHTSFWQGAHTPPMESFDDGFDR